MTTSQAGTAPGQGTLLGGVSAHDFIGAYIDSNGAYHGLIYNGNNITTVDDPLAGTGPGQGTATSNGDGYNIVGTYIDSSGGYHGFIATPTPVTGHFKTDHAGSE